jgi:putative flippase GtrA/SAM-dependent methyltransferase
VTENIVPINIANGLAYISGIAYGFFANKKWAFRDRELISGIKIIRYIVLHAFTLMINIAVNSFVFSFIQGINGDILFAFSIAISITMILNYIGLKYLVFNINERLFGKKIFFRGPYFPEHKENLMSSEGSVSVARECFIQKRFRNLDFLLRFRYEWMNSYLVPNSVIIEIGSGAGFSPLYLVQRPILTDAVENPWIDKFVDATNMAGIESGSVDVLIASHNIHHFYSPYKFFKESERVLKNGGVILIQEINTSFLMRFLLWLMRHEGWSYDVNVFDEHEVVNDKCDLWSANCAVPELLFNDVLAFEREFSLLIIELNKLCECLVFPISGGVISKTKVPELPGFILKSILVLDRVLVKILPSVFALGRRVVIRKRKIT